MCADSAGEAGELADTAAGWRSYAAYLGVLAEEMPRKRAERYGQMSRGWALGAAGFKRGLISKFKQRGADLEQAALLGDTQEGRLYVREICWEEKLCQIAGPADIDLDKLGPRNSDLRRL